MVNKISEQFIFTGFMGCGKSQLLKTLQNGQKPVTLRCVDSDDIILKTHAVTQGFNILGDFIRHKGMDHFRQLESEVIQQCLLDKSPLILAIGGGAFTASNRLLFKQAGAKSVWLNTSFEECFQRIQYDTNRPLVSMGHEKLYELYCQRLSDYQQADIHLRPDKFPVDWSSLKRLLK